MTYKTFRSCDLPEGRAPESFRFRICEVWDGYATDEMWTDSPDEVARIVPLLLEGLYEAQVFERGVLIRHERPADQREV